MPDLFSDMEQPRESDPPTDLPPGVVVGLKCVEPNCTLGLLVPRWSARLSRWFYGCSSYPWCDGTLPADDTGAPRGKPRTKALQRARAVAHAAFDTMWKGRHCSRGSAYVWLQRVMGLRPDQAHMYLMNEEQCAKVAKLVGEKGPGTPFWESWHRPIGKGQR